MLGESRHTIIQLNLVLMHLQQARDVFDMFNLDMTEGDRQAMIEKIDTLRESVSAIVSEQEAASDIEYLDNLFEQ